MKKQILTGSRMVVSSLGCSSVHPATATTRRLETALSLLWVWFLIIVVAILAGFYLELIDTVWLWWHEPR